MGDRAVITTTRATIVDPQNSSELGVYLHTNGFRLSSGDVVEWM